MGTISHFINGGVVPGTGRGAPVYDPATGCQTHEVKVARPEEVDAAVAAAAAAFPQWRRTSLARRSDILFRARAIFDRDRDELARLVTAEHGKVLSDARGEVGRGLENIESACAIPLLLRGNFSEQAATGVDVYSIRQPVGVVVGITPFNFPVMVPMWMFANAIAAGNTFVLKPSEKDPSASLRMAELMAEAGLPDGVFNVVQGDRETAESLIGHERVRAVSFVGSTQAAAGVYARAASSGKRAQALGGAKNHMVVLPDADIEMAADAAVSASYGSAGERCMAVSVVVAVGSVGDRLLAAIADRLPGIQVGPGTEPGAEMGPLITDEHRRRVAGYVARSRSQGATVVVDGRDHPRTSGPGFFLGASLLDSVTTDMDCYRDEIFGPVLSFVRVGTYDEAVAMINANRWGNGAALFTRDGGVARSFQFDVEAGMVGINVPIPVPVAHYSFGGWKDSLFGDVHIYGPEGVNFYTRGKVVTSRWPDPATSAVDLGFPQNT